MRSITVTLVADDTPATIAALAALTSKIDAIMYFRVYPESGNDVDAVKGSARIGDAAVSRDPAGPVGVKGEPLLPGIVTKFEAAGGGAGVYSFRRTYLTGKTGDKFQIQYDCL